MKIDINCDLGEGDDLHSCHKDARIMPFISRCNIACGGHAGSPEIMARSIENALLNNLKIGAHPSYPDRDNFGRKSLPISQMELLDSLFWQVNQLHEIARKFDTKLDHIKLHGALYNDAETNRYLAEGIITLLSREYPLLKIIGLANGAMEAIATEKNRLFYREGFIDRQYLNTGQLVPRSLPDSVLHDIDSCLERAVALARGSRFTSYHGTPLQFSVDTICLHGDNPEAVNIAQRLASYLQLHGLSIHS
ncbi:5-oxoprolinase subunit PxpA [Microbulbifer echini]|uniref:5-oxoprolinase subunit PxpA n=1 Tax=Microbulbifer echini TaxID=1529067 RepID=A0ABV4NQZ2_9GAMM|nr:5-oxoprolinase subunit PxpA [uncultured Microbulbifer sp.]